MLKSDWVKEMRLAFSIRPDQKDDDICIIRSDGSINQEYSFLKSFLKKSYFRPQQGATIVSADSKLKWSENEKILLIKGIEKFGIGHFRDISEEFLKDWTPNDLRIKTIRLIGRQNMQLYKDWKGGKEEIEKEYIKNHEIGVRFGCWKQGVLVYDDEGKVLAELIKNL